VAGDPVELEVDHAQVLGALRDLLLEQRLDRVAVRHRVGEVGEVVHPLDERDRLPVLLGLHRLLDAGVDVADDRLDLAHDLALERAEQAQDAVSRRVVRPEVDREELGLRLELGRRRGGAVGDALHRDRLLALSVGSGERVWQRRLRGLVSHTSAGARARCA
jgi:hypothetical protein